MARFSMIPFEMFSDNRLTLRAMRVYGVLAAYCGDRADCYPSQETIASMAGMHREDVSRAITSLCELGYVQRLGSRNRQRYILPLHPVSVVKSITPDKGSVVESITPSSVTESITLDKGSVVESITPSVVENVTLDEGSVVENDTLSVVESTTPSVVESITRIKTDTRTDTKTEKRTVSPEKKNRLDGIDWPGRSGANKPVEQVQPEQDQRQGNGRQKSEKELFEDSVFARCKKQGIPWEYADSRMDKYRDRGLSLRNPESVARMVEQDWETPGTNQMFWLSMGA